MRTKCVSCFNKVIVTRVQLYRRDNLECHFNFYESNTIIYTDVIPGARNLTDLSPL